MKLAFKCIFVLTVCLIFGGKAFAQDTIRTNKKVYQISPGDLKKHTNTIEQSRTQAGIKSGTENMQSDPNASIKSCEINSKTNEVIITKIQEDGKVVKEIYEHKPAQ